MLKVGQIVRIRNIPRSDNWIIQLHHGELLQVISERASVWGENRYEFKTLTGKQLYNKSRSVGHSEFRWPEDKVEPL